MAIKDWDEATRPREKLLQRGAHALTDAELLAIFLRTGVKGKSALDLAQDLLNEFGDLRSMLGADQQRFCEAKGLGAAKYVQLQASVELSKRYLRQCLQRGDALTNPQDTRNYLLTELSGRQHEVFACVFLDNKNRVIKYEELFYGTIDGASVHPREVVKRALHHNAAAIIFAHNHPSGIAEPSQNDVTITQHLKQALSLVDIRVLDHFVVGDGSGVSLNERGLI
ncbi:DNA repair protein RadC [Candidatus Albibeggiatoa sp. nov. NOAA]|uniref:RadC family protein n=1 Tax=Candidatus Albibeggiatoa sp. nov. NOAA TaxID=3162724 RepID=UPI0032F4836D|nr:DNA repair protein RadC [Thiotrichaceae bacterium]